MTARKPTKKTPSSVEAREAEAEDGFVKLEQCGVKLRIPVGGKLPLAAIDRYRVGDNYGGTKAMIGEEQWARLVEAGATSGDLDEIAKKVDAAAGNS
ncbi:adenylosuccinate synthase [Mycobacterium sp. NPDC050041]|uniref:adenylosuccinate synthase n=1 Tax=Mycobacterium sp. NPDC050041 TaxID=3364293 RepID=UPI003C301E89